MIAGAFESEPGHIYYVHPDGDDAGPGSEQRPWRSLDRIADQDLRPGDRVQLAAGASFHGSLQLGPRLCASPQHPVVICGAADAPARIIAPRDAPALAVRDAGGIELRHLEFIGPGATSGEHPGVAISASQRGCRYRHVLIADCQVHGFRKGGVVVWSEAEDAGFEDLRCERVACHDNGQAGIDISGLRRADGPHSHRRVAVVDCRCWHNHGDTRRRDNHTGSGIVVGGVDGGLVEYSSAWANGSANSSDVGGPVGIWAWDSRAVTIQYCISHHNRTGSSKDGGGFDLDGGCEECVVQFNLSYHNDGAGYLLCQYPGAQRFAGNTVRFNCSHDDGRRNGYGGIHLAAGAKQPLCDTSIHNNTVVMHAADQAPAVVVVDGTAYADITIAGNCFIGVHAPLLRSRAEQGLRIVGNAWHEPGMGGAVYWGGRRFDQFDEWLATVGQERYDSRVVALRGELGLTGIGRSPRITDPHALGDFACYVPRADSPLLGGGVALAGLGITCPGRDLRGRVAPAGILIGCCAPDQA
ncbi:MAG: right-handed parallel beta-helix repeat-containing protein [Planctomycetota bacterium]|jgi:hypothetical protein|nr:right-handed parallel beta-helix repeat-containing protein [Planctomycetota bacterium]